MGVADSDKQAHSFAKNSDASDDPVLDEQGNVINVIPVEQKGLDPNNVKSMYDIEFSDDEDEKKYEQAKKAEEDRLAEQARKAEAVRKKLAEIKEQEEQEIEKRKEAELARIRAEEEARKRAEEEARRKAEEEARRKAEEERRKAEEEARRKAEEEARRKAEEEALRKAQEEARRKAAEEEERRRVEAEIKRRAEERRKAEEEEQRRKEEERRRLLEEKRKRDEEEARRIMAEEARRAAEEARRKAEEDARKKAEEEARKKAEEEARKQAEEEARKQAEEEARKQAEEEARKKAEEEARIKAEEEAKKRAEEEARKMAEEEARKQAEEEIRKKAEEEEARRIAEQKASAAAALPNGAEEFLGKYMTIDSISQQMRDAITSIDSDRSSPRNVIILCKHGFGTTTIGIDFAKSFYAMGVCKNSTVAVIKAAAFNKVDLSTAVPKLQGGCLVVENAGNVRPEKMEQLADIMSDSSNDIAVILTGEIDSLSKLFSSNAKMVPHFKHLIQMHRIDNNAVYEIAQNYIKQLGYEADSRALSKLKNLMLGVEDGNLDRVIKMVDGAISRAEDRAFRELGSGSSDQKILLDSDFE